MCRSVLLLPFLALIPAASCAPRAVQVGTGTATPAEAEAVVRDAQGNVLGTLSLAQETMGIRITGSLVNVPAGVHGFHVHTTGRCEPPFTTAGGHWNPAGRQHGADNPNGKHQGDLPNVTANAQGNVLVNVLLSGASIRGGTTPLLDADGAAFVVHAVADDYRTDPAGNAGARIACGVVTAR